MQTIEREELFTTRLRELRTEVGKSAREMSLEMGQNPGYINSIEHGKSMPNLRSFFQICDYLNVTPSYFLSPLEDDVKNKETAELIRIIEELDDKNFDAVCVLLKGLAN